MAAQMISISSPRKVVADHALPYLCQYLGVNAAFRAAQQKRLLILCYHSVVSDQHYSPLDSDYAIGLKAFRAQMEILAHYFQPITVSDLAGWRAEKGVSLRNPVLVTFDDGYRNNLTNAAPVLLQYGIPAVIHVSTGYINRERMLWIFEIYRRILRWPEATVPMPGSEADKKLDDPQQRLLTASRVRQACKRLPHQECESYLNRLREVSTPELEECEQEVFDFLSWDEVRTLRRQGFEIGSHTVEHPILTRVPGPRADQELHASKRAIEEQVGTNCRCFAYPNGGEADISQDTEERVKRAGYDFAFTTVGKFCSRDENAFELGRICIPGNLTPIAFHARISGFHNMLKRYTMPHGVQA